LHWSIVQDLNLMFVVHVDNKPPNSKVPPRPSITIIYSIIHCKEPTPTAPIDFENGSNKNTRKNKE